MGALSDTPFLHLKPPQGLAVVTSPEEPACACGLRVPLSQTLRTPPCILAPWGVWPIPELGLWGQHEPGAPRHWQPRPQAMPVHTRLSGPVENARQPLPDRSDSWPQTGAPTAEFTLLQSEAGI